MDRLENYKATPRKIWEWILNNDYMRLLHIKGEVMDVYKPLQVDRYATTSNRCTRVQIAMPIAKVGKYCTIR